ncbi:MAG TPA: pilus assembly protein TadG-related protein [Gemmataceae bacterium]|nr:pilus assembly protein TadG-related protein [Gemmataceae bacterium]
MTQRQNSRRSGAVAPLVAMLMVVLCVVISIVLEEGMMLSESRRAQAAADAGAMAGACVLYQNYKTTAGVDSASVTAATQMAADNGYLNDASGTSPDPGTTSVVANNPPSTGFFKGQAGYIEVLTTYNQGRYFSWVLSLWPINATLDNTMPVTARAVAQGMWVPFHAGVLLLQYNGADLQEVGNATLNINGGDFILDSNSQGALVRTGNATVTVNNGNIDITGNDTGAQNNTNIQTPNGAVYINQHPTPDPLAYLPAPGSGNGAPDIPPKAPKPQNVTLPDGTQAVLLWPGSYGGNGEWPFPSNSSNNGPVYILMQANNPQQGQTDGIFYIKSGSFSFRNTTVMTDNNLLIPGIWNGPLDYQGSTGGAMIYMATGAVSLEGSPSGFVYMNPLTDGPYSGMSFWQDRSNTSADKITGNGSFTINGTFYAPTGSIDVGGNGGSYTGSLGTQIAGSQIGSQFIASTMFIHGNGTVNVNYQGPPKQPTRILTLVE